MKNILTQIFVVLGVLFTLLILAGIYFYIIDPYNIKPLIIDSEVLNVQPPNQPKQNTSTATQETNSTAQNPGKVVEGGFQLSNAQKQALVGLGIDPTKVPSSITAAQETCFIGTLGEARVVEIKAGAVPNAVEFLKAKSCI